MREFFDKTAQEKKPVTCQSRKCALCIFMSPIITSAYMLMPNKGPWYFISTENEC